MCTAAILGIAQLGVGLATSFGQYQLQKKQIEKEKQQTAVQNKQIEEQKQAVMEVQKVENTENEREKREEAALSRANAGAGGIEFSGSAHDVTSQYMQDQNLNQQTKELQDQMKINQYDYQKKSYDKPNSNYGFVGGIAKELLNYASKL